MHQNNPTTKVPFLPPIIARLAKDMGADVLLEPEFGFVGHVTFPNGKTTFFRSASLDINPLGAVEIAKDKGYAAFFLSSFGFPIPQGQTFFSKRMCRNVANPRDIDDGFIFAKSLGFPVIVKPNRGSQGFLVTKVYTKKEYYRAARAILQSDPVMLVQQYYPGNDYRIVVLDDKVISAYQRLPLTIIGDGRSTIEELIHKKQQEYKDAGRDVLINIHDFRILMKLRRQKLDLTSVINADQHVQLLDTANLSTGGSATDFTATIHCDWSALAINIASRMGLRLCGVDIITNDITVAPSQYIVLEVNGAPGLDNYAATGKDQARLVENLYTQILYSLRDR